ncbi:MAG: hypothetical protein M3550_06245 [Actinomycetota bacterium]|nr:hypothetical protein [Actinomycetota bacterium]
MRQRGAGLLALVDDQVQVGRTGVLAHALAPYPHCGLDLLGRDLGQRMHRVRRVDDHLVGPERGLGSE